MGGSIAWGAYTDHEPVEVTISCAKSWSKNGKEGPAGKTLDWSRMPGPTKEAKDKQIAFEKEMARRLSEEDDTYWKKICEIDNEAASETLGTNPRRQRGRKAPNGGGDNGKNHSSPKTEASGWETQ